MKIAMVTNYFPVLSETFVLNQITGLLKRGHQVDIYPVLGRPNRSEPMPPLVQEYELLSRTYYGRKPPAKSIARRVEACRLLLLGHAFQPHVVMSVLYRMVAQPRANLWAVPYALRLPLRKRSYDIVHCQFGTVGAVVGTLKKMGLLEGKLVSTFRGSDISRHVFRHGAQVYSDLLEQADLLLTNCDYFRRRVMDIGGAPEKVAVLRSGIDLSLFDNAMKPSKPKGKFRVVTNARLVEKKGVEFAIRGVAGAVREGASLEYVVVGEGPLRQSLEELVRAEGIGHCTTFRGDATQSELVRELEKADVFIAPSVRARDGNEDAPINTLKEAMAMRVPVISTRHGGIPELVQDGQSGFLVNERDSAAITERLLTLVGDHQLRRDMGAAGRDYVSRVYDIEQLNDELVGCYERLMS